MSKRIAHGTTTATYMGFVNTNDNAMFAAPHFYRGIHVGNVLYELADRADPGVVIGDEYKIRVSHGLVVGYIRVGSAAA